MFNVGPSRLAGATLLAAQELSSMWREAQVTIMLRWQKNCQKWDEDALYIWLLVSFPVFLYTFVTNRRHKHVIKNLFFSTLLRSLTPSRWSFPTLGAPASCFLRVRSRQSGQSYGLPQVWWVVYNKLNKETDFFIIFSQLAVFALSDWIVLSSPSRPPVILWDLTLLDRRRC